MLKRIKDVLKSDQGATELTSQIFILMGVGTIIAALIIIFRTQLTAMVEDMLGNFRDKSGSNW